MADRREPSARLPRLARGLLAELTGAAARRLERLATTLRPVAPEAPVIRGRAARRDVETSAPAFWLRYVREHGVGEWESFEHPAAARTGESALRTSQVPTVRPELVSASRLTPRPIAETAAHSETAPEAPPARAAARTSRPAARDLTTRDLPASDRPGRDRPVRLQPLNVDQPTTSLAARVGLQPAARTPLETTPSDIVERDDRTTVPRRTSRESKMGLRNSLVGSLIGGGRDRRASNPQTVTDATGPQQQGPSRPTEPQPTVSAPTHDAWWQPTASRRENGGAIPRTSWPPSLRPEPDPPPLHEMLRVMEELRHRERLAREQSGDPWSA